MMKGKLFFRGHILLIVSIFICLFFVNTEFIGAYQLTARSFGMGGAFTAVADDVEAVLYNPAGMADNGVVGLDFSGGVTLLNRDELEKLEGIQDNTEFEYINDNLSGITEDIGLDYQVFFGAKLSSIGLAHNIKDNHLVEYNNGDYKYSNKRVSESIFTYGNEIINPPLDLGTLSYGFNLKLIDISKQAFNMGDNTEKKSKGNGFGVDFGLLAKVSDNIRVGCVVENILPTDVDLDGEKVKYNPSQNGWDAEAPINYSEEEDFDTNVRIGAVLDVPVVNLKLAADIDNLLDNNDAGQVLHLGLEKDLFLNFMTLRAGKITGSDVNITTLGFGMNLSGFNLDFAVGEDNKRDDITALLSANMKF